MLKKYMNFLSEITTHTTRIDSRHNRKNIKLNIFTYGGNNYSTAVYEEGITDEQIDYIKRNLNLVRKSCLYENIDDKNWYFKLLKQYSYIGANIFRIYGYDGFGTHYSNQMLETLTAVNTFLPKYISRDWLGIGRYMENQGRIFINKNGEIFVYSLGDSAMVERRYLLQYDKFSPQLTQKMYDDMNWELVGYWTDINDFLIDETKRSIEICKKTTYQEQTSGKVDFLPYNVTPEILNKLQSEKKINPRGSL